MDPSTLTYEKRPGCATTHGQYFEVHLAALIFLRGLNSGLDFQLATNVKDADVLDDLVFRYKESSKDLEPWTTLYVQLKYKENSMVNQRMLTCTKNDFSLPKTYKAFCKIEGVSIGNSTIFSDTSIDNSLFIIMTNAKPDKHLKGEISEIPDPAARFVWTGKGRIFSFIENEDILKSFDESLGEARDTFLERFLLFCQQKTGDKLVEVVKSELLRVAPEILKGLDVDSLCERYLVNVKNWWEKRGTGYILHKDHDILRNAVSQVILESCSQQTLQNYKLTVDFEKECTFALRKEIGLDIESRRKRVIFIQSSENAVKLSLTKLLNAMEVPPLVLDCRGVIKNETLLVSKLNMGQLKRLVVCANDWSIDEPDRFLAVVKNFLAVSRVFQLILLFPSSEIKKFAKEIHHNVEIYMDTFSFTQLNVKFCNEILLKEVHFQGKTMTLRMLLGDSDLASADRMLDAQSVVEILDNTGGLTVGTGFDKGINYFIKRRLEISNIVKASIFDEEAISESVTIMVETTACPKDLFKVTLNFLQTFLPDKFSVHQRKVFLARLLRLSSLCQDTNGYVNISPSILVGALELSIVSLGKENAVTALRVCTSKIESEKYYIIFVSDKSNENYVQKLTDFHQSMHFLSLKNGTLRWVQSSGDINTIRPHIDKEQIEKLGADNVNDIEDRLVLVCAEPGMGKSTLMAQLARETKETCPHFFVVLISLNEQTKLFYDGKHKDALRFLLEAANVTSPLHKTLLKYALEVTGNVVVFLDGYDEIAPKYVKKSCDLVLSFLQTKALKIWMTSRNSIRNDLETHVSKFALKIVEFNKNDQRNFLELFWKDKSILGAVELNRFVSQLITKTLRAVCHKENNLLSIPLQIMMLAEIYEDYVTGVVKDQTLPDTLDLLDLLEQVVDKKCKIFVKDKLQIPDHDAKYQFYYLSIVKNFFEIHYKAGFDLLLDNYQPKELGLKCTNVELEKLYRDNLGFVDDVVNDKPRFLHRVFAEYFVAKWISENYKDKRVLIETKLFTADFSVVRTIFDMILARNCSLHRAVLTENVGEVRKLVEGNTVNVNAKDDGGRSALHLAASLGSSENQKANKRRMQILEFLLLSKTTNFDVVDKVLGSTPLRYADITHWWNATNKFLHHPVNTDQLVLTRAKVDDEEMLDTIFELDLNHLLEFCLKNGLSVEHCSVGKKRLLIRACKKGSLQVANLLVKNNAQIFNTARFLSDNFVVEQDNEEEEEEEDESDDIHEVVYTNPLHWATTYKHINIAKLLCQKYISINLADKMNVGAKNLPKPSFYVNQKDKNGETAMHHAAKNNHPKTICFLRSQGGDVQSCNVHNIAPLHWAAWYRHPKAVTALLNAMDKDKRQNAVNAHDNDGDSVLHYAAEGGSVECLELLVQAGGKLSKTNNSGHTPLTLAVEAGNLKVVQSILNLFNVNVEGMEKSDFINLRDINGETAIHVASRNGHTELLTFLISQGGDLLICDGNDCTPLHWAARYKHPDTLRVLLEVLAKTGMTDFVNSLDKDGDSVLACAKLGECSESVALLEVARGIVAG